MGGTRGGTDYGAVKSLFIPMVGLKGVPCSETESFGDLLHVPINMFSVPPQHALDPGRTSTSMC